MSFQISEIKTPILHQQPEVVKNAAQQFVQNYTNRNSVKVRAAWGAFLEQIQNGLQCATVGKGDKARTLDCKETFTAICRELGIARSTAYLYINTHIAFLNYPEAIQDAAYEAGLNLALPHVMAAYQKMTIPTKPSSFEVKGIIAELQEASPAVVPPVQEPITRDELVKALARLIKRGLKSLGNPSQVVSAVDQAMKDAEVPQSEQEAITHAALDVVDKSLGINTRLLESVPGDVAASQS